MKVKYIIAFVLIVVGAILTFGVKPILNKKIENEELLEKYIYIVKIIGMWLVVIGAISIFILGGSFGG